MCEKKGPLHLGFILGDNEAATDGCSGGGLGRTVGITVTTKMQGEGEELTMFVFQGRAGGRQEERGLGGRSALV